MKLDHSEILDILCNYYYIDKQFLFKKTRKTNVVRKRQLFYFLCYKHTDLSYETIGKIRTYYATGDKHDHATVWHSVKKIKGDLDVDKKFKEKYAEIDNLIKQHIQKPVMPKMVVDRVDLLEMTERLQSAKKEIQEITL